MKEATRSIKEPNGANRLWLLTLAGSFLLVLTFRIVLAFFPSSNSAGAENNIIYFIQQLLRGENLYMDPASPPFAIAQYTPLYYQLLAIVARILSISADDVLLLFRLNRTIAIILDLGSCFIIASILKNRLRIPVTNAWLAALTAFLFLLPWSRPDNAALLFWIAAVYVFLKMLDSGKQRDLWLAVVFSSLAVLSKQSAITIALIIGGWLLVRKDLRRFALFTAGYIVLTIAGMLLLSLTSGVPALFKNIILGIDNGVSLDYYFSIFQPYYAGGGFIALLAFVCALAFASRDTSATNRFIAFAALLQFVLLNMFALKTGSGLNYLTEWLMLLVVLATIYRERWRRMFALVHPRAALMIVTLIIIFKASSFIYPLAWYMKPVHHKTAGNLFLTEQRLARYLQQRDSQSYVLTDIPTTSTYFSNLFGKRLLIPQSDIISTVYQRNIYDFSAFDSILQRRSPLFFISRDTSKLKRLYDRSVALVSDTSIGPYTIYTIE